MKKKLVSLILILVLCVSVLSGCVLFQTSTKDDYAQIVASIRNVEIGTDATPQKFSKNITKRDLILAYINFGQSSTEGMGIEAALNTTLDQLITKELVLARYHKLLNNGEIVPTEAQKAQDYNKAWKAVYDYCDQQIDYYQNQIYASAGKSGSAPQKGSASTEPQYPSNTLVVKTEEDANKDNAENYIPEPFTPDPANIPKSNDDIRLKAAKDFIIGTIQQFNDIKLNKDEEKLLQADKDFINNNANKALIYEKIMGNGSIGGDATGFYCIRRLIAESQFQQAEYERVQEYFNDWIEVSDDDVQTYYANTLEEQRSKFDSRNQGYLDTYYNAVKDTSATPFVFYHPTEEVFYVKHILIPFSDAQKADIEKYGNGHTAAQKKAYRDGIAKNIMSYQHYNGYDDLSKGLFSMDNIYNDIRKSLPKGDHYGAEWAFNNLIFKYNTDTGIFNNESGYIMPPKDKGIASGYMTEFERAAYKLFENGKPGDFLEEWAITDYGVHLMYYSSNTGRFTGGREKGIVTLSDYTSPLRIQTYERAVKDYLLNAAQTKNFDFVQNQIKAEYIKDENYVKKYAGRYADIVKSAQKAADAANAANPTPNPADTATNPAGF